MKIKNKRVWMLLICMSVLFFHAPLNMNAAYAATNDVGQTRKEDGIDIGNVGQAEKHEGSKRCDVTFRCATSDQKKIFRDEKFVIYQITDEDGAIQSRFLDVKVSEDESKYAKNLADSITDTEKTNSYAEITTGTDGSAVISLPYGTYLITGDVVSESGYTYTPVPFLITLDSSMEAKLTSYVKYETTEPSPVSQNPMISEQEYKYQDRQNLQKVKTNDTNELYIYITLAVISALIFTITIIQRRNLK